MTQNAVDPALLALATQYSIPPSMMFAVHTMATDKSEAAMQTVAKMLDQKFQQHRNWEAAVSEVVTGDAGIHQNPTNPSAGKVNAILGIAASRPDYGMQGWKPVDVQRFAGAAKAMEKTARGLARLGGVVTPAHVDAWGKAITTVKHPPAVTAPQDAPPEQPSPPPAQPNAAHAREVGEFASQLKAMGATPEHFKQLFPIVATSHRALLGKQRVEVSDFAPHVGQTPDLVHQSVRAMPSHKSPAHTAGEFQDAWNVSQLHSVHHVGRMPFISEITNFLSGNLKHTDIDSYYKRMAAKKAGMETTLPNPEMQPNLQVMDGGANGNA